MDVPKIGAQFRQVLLDVKTGAISPDERLDGKSVPKAVEPAAQSHL